MITNPKMKKERTSSMARIKSFFSVSEITEMDPGVFETNNYYLYTFLPANNSSDKQLKILYRNGLHKFAGDNDKLKWCIRAYHALVGEGSDLYRRNNGRLVFKEAERSIFLLVEEGDDTVFSEKVVNPQDANQGNEFGSLLYCAARSNQVEMVRKLILRRADPNVIQGLV